MRQSFLDAGRPGMVPYPTMAKDVYEVRKANLRRLSAEWGGPTSLARKLGHSNGSALAQVIGPNPRRLIGERQARDIERTLSLPVGYLDAEHAGKPREPVQDERLARTVAAVATVAQDTGKVLAPAKFADVVAMVYATGQVDESFIKQLVRLAT